MLEQYPVSSILFLDIETVPQYASFSEVPESWKHLWEIKAGALLKNREEETVESIYERAGIYAEFGKIICISCGVVQGAPDQRKIILKSFYGDDEKKLLQSFSEMLQKFTANEQRYLCAHNGKEFDFPYICRRLLINRLPIPVILNTAGRKPWEVSHLDTMEFWKFGDFKSYTTLNLLAHSLDVPTPKDDIDGSMVAGVFYKEKNIERIVTYCQKDVVTVAQVFLRMNGEELITESNIEYR
ncbi:3'-5' exonuclease [Niabella ginsenosidivorans]|uniref:3'-5' exonuclease n=1 Tax=Niabella ginsenosidivorans TaxID=1176587 RepID=A0A1A9I963_9BACT|nr:3'-5' exonuclease [Niabella ginsenosidivorans]ANH83211.1 3'-5' exonuclease [Niabella ginsenosidivorans]